MESLRFPAEWEKQQSTLLCYPHNGIDWPGKYQAIQWAFVEFIKKIATFQDVLLMVAHQRLEDRVREKLEKAHVDSGRISYLHCKTNRSWMRDSGPVVVQSDEGLQAVNFHFNGWAKYRNYMLDRKVPAVVSGHLDIPIVSAKHEGRQVVLEGGAIDVNGQGTLLTSEICLLHPSIQVRNPGFSRKDYEMVFKKYLGVTQVIWLEDGIAGDDTHGHIDDLCRFVSEDTVVTVVESDPADSNYRPLKSNRKRLQKQVLANGKTLNVVELPMPEKLVFEGVRLPASYANFLIINDAVLVPVFNDVNDREALNILSACFPDRTVIGMSAIDLIWGFGSFHCLSQQIPVQSAALPSRGVS